MRLMWKVRGEVSSGSLVPLLNVATLNKTFSAFHFWLIEDEWSSPPCCGCQGPGSEPLNSLYFSWEPPAHGARKLCTPSEIAHLAFDFLLLLISSKTSPPSLLSVPFILIIITLARYSGNTCNLSTWEEGSAWHQHGLHNELRPLQAISKTLS